MQQASVQQQTQHGGSLRFNGIGKTFPGVKALSDINFEARPGSVHALMGENGAGKSTLLKILGGSYQPNSGDLQIGDEH
ncbi:ATP-binding cassette domain-containing protein, partial [Shigella sonnei]